MLRYLVRQLAVLVLVLAVASFVVFAAMFVAPGSPDAVLFGNQPVQPEVRKAVYEKYHLDDPYLERYVNWLGGVVTGDLGLSIAYRQPVSDRITTAAPTTLFLVGYAGVLIVLSGIGLGTLSALRRGKVDAAVGALTTIGIAIPTFVAAALLTSLFAVNLGLFPVQGPGEGFLDRLWHLTLPAISLAIWASALLARVTRSSMLDELRSEHVMTARARGLPRTIIVRHHVLRNALVPILTVAGVQLASLIAGSIVVEQVFGLNGLGQLLVSSVNQKDLPVVQAVCLIMVAVFVIMNTAVDVLYSTLDPRIRRITGAR
jgi:peptide/nickel transport system permease protein